MIVVFDADVFEKEKPDYNRIVEKGLQRNILGITNPSFELFLLLHYENAVDAERYKPILRSENHVLQP